MSQERWTAIDRYFEDALHPRDDALEAALAASRDAGLPPIAVAPNQGKLLQLLALSIGARTILEIGTLGGYSTIWLARALPETGRVVSIELDARHAEIARANIERAGLSAKVDIWVGRALDLLPQAGARGLGPIDFTFIDADKANIPAYFDAAVALSRPGALIVVDNVVRHGAILDPHSTDPDVMGVRRFADRLARDRRVSATALQTVGAKGHDGFAIARVLGEH